MSGAQLQRFRFPIREGHENIIRVEHTLLHNLNSAEMASGAAAVAALLRLLCHDIEKFIAAGATRALLLLHISKRLQLLGTVESRFQVCVSMFRGAVGAEFHACIVFPRRGCRWSN